MQGTGITAGTHQLSLANCPPAAQCRFNTGDLTACADVVLAAVESKDHIPWTDLRYLLGSVFYGGHVVDEVGWMQAHWKWRCTAQFNPTPPPHHPQYDRRLLIAYLDALIHHGQLPCAAPASMRLTARPCHRSELGRTCAPTNLCCPHRHSLIAGLTDEQQPSVNGQPAALELAPGVHLPPPTDYATMQSAIDSFPPDAPQLYSLHANAQLSLLNSQTDTLLATLLVRAGWMW